MVVVQGAGFARTALKSGIWIAIRWVDREGCVWESWLRESSTTYTVIGHLEFLMTRLWTFEQTHIFNKSNNNSNFCAACANSYVMQTCFVLYTLIDLLTPNTCAVALNMVLFRWRECLLLKLWMDAKISPTMSTRVSLCQCQHYLWPFCCPLISHWMLLGALVASCF